MSASQLNQSEAGTVTKEGESEFASLLNREFKPKSDKAREAVESAVQTLAPKTSRLQPGARESVILLSAQAHPSASPPPINSQNSTASSSSAAAMKAWTSA